MQQSSSLPEPNSQVDQSSSLLITIQRLNAELWLERSLKQLQSLLNLGLSQVLRQKTAVFTEADVFQLVLEQLQLALKNYPFSNFYQSCFRCICVIIKSSEKVPHSGSTT